MHIRATLGNCLFVLFLLIGGFGTICSQYGWCTRPTAISTTTISFVGAGIIGFIDRNAHRTDRNRDREGHFRRLLHYVRRLRRAPIPTSTSTGTTEPDSPRNTPLELAQRHWASALRQHTSESSTDGRSHSRRTTPTPDDHDLLTAPPWGCIVPTCPDSFVDLSIFIRHIAKHHVDLLDADDKAVVATGTPLSAVWYLRELLRNNRPRAKRSEPKIEPDSEVQQVAYVVASNSTDRAPPRGIRRATNTIDASQVEAPARRRLVDIHDFGEQQWCVSCGAPASFQDDAGRARCNYCRWRYCSNACQLVDTQGFADDEDEN